MREIEDLKNRSGAWLEGDGPLADVVISSRIRLARNVKQYPFLTRASEDQQKEIFRMLSDHITRSDFGTNAFFVDIDDTSSLDRQFLVERHLISRQHAEGEGTRGVWVTDDEQASLMINEEDHLRIQVLGSGLRLEELWDRIDGIDNIIEKGVDYAFDEKFGYLTACPTNMGTGIRVSVMMHLPALKMTKEIERVLRAAKDMHLAVRGLYGEGTDAIGDFFQISNQATLGLSERDIVTEFSREIIPQIVEYEVKAREVLQQERTYMLDDKIWRAIGLLSNARTMTTEETLFLLSHLRMGVAMGRCKDINIPTINRLFLQTQPAHLQKIHGSELDGENRSIVRAEYLRQNICGN